MYYYKNEKIPENENDFDTFIKKNNIQTDEFWWIEQKRRCINGVVYEDVIEKGGDAILDGRDAIWNDTNKPIMFFNKNIDIEIEIPPTSVYIVDADLMCVDYKVKITGRHYWYLNFWKIMGLKDEKATRKTYIYPKFIDMDFLKAYRVENQIKLGVDNTEAKARQRGYSEWAAGAILAYNYLLLHDSENIIISGNEGDTYNLYMKALAGIDNLRKTQFYRSFSKKTTSKTDMKLIAKRGGNIQAFYTSTDPQILSRLSPYWVIAEEVGKWEQGLIEMVTDFVMPSLFAEGRRTGYFTYIGTGGEMEKGADDLRKIHYSQNSTKYLRFYNKFERKDSSKTKSGWFTSNAWFKYIDKNGNSLFEKGKQATINEIENETVASKKYIKSTQYALYAGDAFTISGAGFFGEHKINLLNTRLSQIRLHKELQIERHGILKWKNDVKPWDGVVFIETDIDEAFITIVEEPMLDENGVPYRNLYEGGIDSYDQDESATSTSMGSAVIRKKFYNTDSTYNTDIAMVLERPDTAHGGKNTFYEHCAMLGIYYGKLAFTIEHTRILIIDWLIWNGFESLVALRPQLAFANTVDKSKSSNKYGVDGSMKPHMLAIMSKDLTDEFIDNMFITAQIEAFAKYQYHRNYNCDITVASAHAAAGAKESANMQVFSSSLRKKERQFKPRRFKRKQGRLIAV